ncbi:MAG: alpha/beta hydrolase [Candidatus Dactylopiibacterium carminicum]|nr:MAG: alpha/beta hydrolase [Candidatus Dactylopiibacterium carminicum]
MQMLRDELAGSPAGRLLILLPPAQARPQDYVDQGFIAAVRQRGIATDVWLPGIDQTHVMARTVVDTLAAEVLVPAQAAGYREIWLAGISLGAFNGLLCASAHAAQLAGLCLLAPYPGTGDILKEIHTAGGPQAWAQTPAAQLGDERVFWRWLVEQQAKLTLPVWFACGAEDRFARNQRLLASLLPPERVRWQPGRHDWDCWRTLWGHWLDHWPL